MGVDRGGNGKPPGAAAAGTGQTARSSTQISRQALVRSPRSYSVMMLSIAMYKGGKLACTGSSAATGVEKGEDMPAQVMCQGVVEDPEKIIVKVSGGV